MQIPKQIGIVLLSFYVESRQLPIVACSSPSQFQ